MVRTDLGKIIQNAHGFQFSTFDDSTSFVVHSHVCDEGISLRIPMKYLHLINDCCEAVDKNIKGENNETE